MAPHSSDLARNLRWLMRKGVFRAWMVSLCVVSCSAYEFACNRRSDSVAAVDMLETSTSMPTSMPSNTTLPAYSIEDLQPGDPPIKCAHYLTWTRYNGSHQGDGRKAEYILDGKSLGVGELGFDNVISSLKILPIGSSVLIYPEYNLGWELRTSRPLRTYPWNAYPNELWNLSKQRKVRLVFAPYDHEGKLLPECRDPSELEKVVE